MMSDWPLVSIDEIKADSKGSIAIGPFGSRMKADCYVDKGIPVIRGTNVTGGPNFTGNFVYITKEKAKTLGSSNVYKHDLVFPHRGSIGEVGIILEDEHYVLSSSLMKLTCDISKVNPKFIYYFFKCSLGRHELLKNASQVGTPGIGQPLTSLKSIELKLPPLDIQNKIEKILTSLDDKIELNRQTNQTLEHIAQAMFKSWFVDFEPTRAKIKAKQNGQDPERAAMAAISGLPINDETGAFEALEKLPKATLQQLKITANLFPDTLVNSELGVVPDGWEVCELGELLEFNPKRTLKKGQLAPYLDMKNVPTQGHLADDVYLREMASGTKFINGDTLLARITPCLENGKTAYVDFLEDDQVAWGSTEYIVMRPKNSRPLSLGYIIARLDTFRAKAIQTMTGTSGRQRANAKALSEQLWINYPKFLLDAFDAFAGSYLAKAKVNGDENKTLTELRDTLLPKLLSGEIILDVKPKELVNG